MELIQKRECGNGSYRLGFPMRAYGHNRTLENGSEIKNPALAGSV